MEYKREELININVKGDTKIEVKNNISEKTKAILERDNVNRKFKRVKRKSNTDSGNRFYFLLIIIQ
jgi:hypothetical protein